MKTAIAKRVRWTVKDYFRMSNAGLLGDRRVELLNGDVIKMAAQASPHSLAVTRTVRILVNAFGPDHWVVVQGTLVLSKFSAPDPDFHIFDVPEGTPDDRLPLPILVIEVSDSTYRKDSGPKLRTYARAGIAEYWIFNIPQDRIEAYRQPVNPTGKPGDWKYASVEFRHHGEQVTLQARPALSFPVDAILP